VSGEKKTESAEMKGIRMMTRDEMVEILEGIARDEDVPATAQ
jgi:hypothetical protein